jgi:hypothetical protein
MQDMLIKAKEIILLLLHISAKKHGTTQSSLSHPSFIICLPILQQQKAKDECLVVYLRPLLLGESAFEV